MESSVGTRPDASDGIAPPHASKSGSGGDNLVELSVGMRLDASEGIAPTRASQSGSGGEDVGKIR